MKLNKRKFKKLIPAYAFGTDEITSALGMLAGLIGPSTATSAQQADAQGITSALGGIATGAKIGSSIVPIAGGILGGIGGGIVGAIGKSGKTTETPGFAEDNQYTYSTGLNRLFGGSGRDRRRIARDRANVAANKSAVAGSINLQNDYYTDNQMDAYMLQYGGDVSSQLAYVDDGELLDTPNGIMGVPENNQPTDSNLVNLPSGSRVLSDTLKVPGTKKTFAQVGKQMMSSKKSKGKSKIAETTNMLNELNDQLAYDQLYQLQELTKYKKGIMPKTKGIDSFVVGGEKDDKKNSALGNFIDYIWQRSAGVPDSASMRNDVSRLMAELLLDQSSAAYQNYRGSLSVNPLEPSSGLRRPIQRFPAARMNRLEEYPMTVEEAIAAPTTTAQAVRSVADSGGATTSQQASARQTQQPVVASTGAARPTGNLYRAITPEMTRVTGSPVFNIPKSAASTTGKMLRAITPETARVKDALTLNIPKSVAPTPGKANMQPVNRPQASESSFDWDRLVSSIGALAPIISNLVPGSAEQIRPEQNPYADAILSTMRNRRINVNPILNKLDLNRATTNYNMDQLNTNTGANMAARLGLATMLGNQYAEVLANAQNANNQYAGEYAETMNNVGQQYVQANRLAQDYNSRSRAQNRNIRRAGLGQLSDWTQAQYRDRNLRKRDAAYLKAYGPLLEGAYTKPTYEELLNLFNI